MELSTHTDIINGVPARGAPDFELIQDELNQVKELINKQLIVPAKTGDISQLLEYLNARSGKMIRPGLVLLAGSAIGKITDKHMRVAAIVEMIHNATLLHDDVIDEGQKRRGLPTINSLWGNESAVLLGDFLLSQVFIMCVNLGPKITNIIASAAAQTCKGELRQIIQRHNWQLSESQYIDIITEKSAAFFSSCCRLGALLAHASETQIKSFECFGLNAGIAFQITDDLLDLVGDESQTGKTAGSDVDKNKPTLATIHLMRVLEPKDKRKVHTALSHTAPASKNTLLKMLSSHGSLEYAHSRAQKFVTKAVRALTNLKKSNAKEALIETAKFMANRAI